MTASVPALLQPMKDRLNAATPGPWRADAGGESPYVDCTSDDIALNVYHLEDATLIAAAPTDQAKLIAAIEAVLAVTDRWEEDFQHKAWQVRAALTQALGGDGA